MTTMTTTDATLFGRGLSFPPRLSPDGRVAWSAGPDNIRESIRVILMTDPGERLMLAPFGAGLRTFLFEPNVVATHRLIEERVTNALTRWEPRIRVQAVDVARSAEDPRRVDVRLEYSLVATGATDSATVSIRVEG